MNLIRAVVLLALLPMTVLAHEHWFSPSDYVTRPGTAVAVSVRIGEGLCGPAKPYSSARTVGFTAVTERRLDVAPAASDGDTVWTRLTPIDEGGVLLGWESNFVGHRMEAAKFDAYLESDGLDGPRATRRAARDTSAGRERYRRCTKTWLAGTRPDRGRVTNPLGLPLEIVPLEIPGRDSVLEVQVLFVGKALEGALVQGWRAPFAAGSAPRLCVEERAAEADQRVRTDANGIARIRLDTPGEWVLGTVHMVPCAARDEADWESTWASLTFARVATWSDGGASLPSGNASPTSGKASPKSGNASPTSVPRTSR